MRVYFWSNENNEPIHVHISKAKPSQNSTKVWLTRSGGCICASNASQIPQKDLAELLEVIAAQHFFISEQWKKYFVVNDIKFFC